MPTGLSFWRKRPRNDLDDYLEEVDSHLFCVSRADRMCLHRDLKAHVRELTAESDTTRFSGRYGITTRQLEDEIGQPDKIASMYISSVNKVPSNGLRGFLGLAIVVFASGVLIGILRSGSGEPSTGISGLLHFLLNVLLIIGGFIAIYVSYLNIRSIEKHKNLLPFITLGFLIVSVPVTLNLSSEIVLNFNIIAKETIMDNLVVLIIGDFIIITFIAMHLSLRHVNVFHRERMDIA